MSALSFQPVPVLLPRSAVSDAPARQAFKPSTGGAAVLRIGQIVESSSTCRSRRASSAQVSRSAYGLEVPWVDAVTNAAQVVKIQACRRVATVLGIEGPMRQLCAVDASAHLAVSIGIDGAQPDPATAAHYLVARQVVDAGVCRKARNPLAPVVLFAEAQFEATRNALCIQGGAAVHNAQSTTHLEEAAPW